MQKKRTSLLPANFDPDGAAVEGSGIYGLPFSPENAKVVIIPVPFEATTSYGGGTSEAPEVMLEASRQVDLFDRETGKPYREGIAMLPIPKDVVAWNRHAKTFAKTVIAKGGVVDPKTKKAAAAVNAIGEKVNDLVYKKTKELFRAGKMPVVLGGDHAVPFGAIKAYLEKYPNMGLLHFDAHADLRNAFEGFTWSHASIFFNTMTKLPAKRLVQVGVRDFGEREKEMIEKSKGRITTFFDADLAARKEKGEPFQKIADDIVSKLPKEIYISWDIDVLDPSLCPTTGTPVAGGLSWNEALAILKAIHRAKKKLVGFDLCEVGSTEWDANVGARLLYKLIGYMLLTGK